MKHRGVIFSAVLVASGCAAIAGLGEEATLQSAPLDAGQDVNVVVEAAAETSTRPCGLEPSPNPTCASCNDTNCCAEALACNGVPRCIQAIECLRECAFVSACVEACFQEYSDTPQVQAISSCSGGRCPACIPNPQCLELGYCCRAMPDAGPKKSIRDFCIGRVFQDQAASCTSFLEDRRDAGDCP